MLVGYKINISQELERETSCLPHLNFRSTVYWYTSFRVHLWPVCYSHLGFYFFLFFYFLKGGLSDLLFIYLFIFIYGCVGSSPLCEGFL